ncbi:16S rRNA (cytidine(1402)-2'-O)-methyltransferase [Patescibacteria group bacterium]|nr:16S rRNA (cytidine(1402)-2'-O)-methyltransferase [Patescibacteria group bacterium]MBU1015593.1 16S rRNA (cytidine(1402)-2'-O)-methyltransferase [Patescibacteria group bacterium]MBU1685000.1 16S rRNA (cytidine(1402)-2'-O)-methyltransferase [Patescibacteria group bacterium]MBU1938106.1 16S rRNA (cytidine(1402)-2'-O)-methyltransferase [Patescibacteria group bacterium]
MKTENFSQAENGKLYIVATPIGNLADLTFRAKEVLENVDLVACEDTRHTGILLSHYKIDTPKLSFHSHSGQAKVDKIMAYLEDGKDVALVSDAGTPGISDPGYVLVQAALEAGVQVVPIPGASAVITALCASGLPTDKYLYLGFLPVKKGRQTIFKKIAESEYTVVFYESPHRLRKTLEQLGEFLNADARVVVAKELTKIYETYYRGTLQEVMDKLPENIKGEYVVMVYNQ